jgi:hypothetical protein
MSEASPAEKTLPGGRVSWFKRALWSGYSGVYGIDGQRCLRVCLNAMRGRQIQRQEAAVKGAGAASEPGIFRLVGKECETFLSC